MPMISDIDEKLDLYNSHFSVFKVLHIHDVYNEEIEQYDILKNIIYVFHLKSDEPKIDQKNVRVFIEVFESPYEFIHYNEKPDMAKVEAGKICFFHYSDENGNQKVREFFRINDRNDKIAECEILHHCGNVTKDSLNELLKINEQFVKKFVLMLHAKEAEEYITLYNSIDDSSIPGILGICANHVTIVIAEAHIDLRADYISLSHGALYGGQLNIISNQPDQKALNFGVIIDGNTIYSGKGVDLASGYKVQNCAVKFPSSSITIGSYKIPISDESIEYQDLTLAGGTH